MRVTSGLHSMLSMIFLVSVLLPACGPRTTPVAPVILRNWEGDISQDILDAFTAETGIPVEVRSYESQEEALEDLRAGEVADVVVLENQLIPGAVADGLLAEINYQNVPNFRNISPNFRDMAYDPNNRHAIPYSWGTTGMVVRTDLTDPAVSSWNAFWDPAYASKIIAWPLPRYVLGVTLKALGYSANSEDPARLARARDKLIEIMPHLRLLEWEPAVSAPYLISGEAILAMGQADDVTAGQAENPNIAYIMPREGGLLWGDNFTIPANSSNKAHAESLIDFLLRGDVSAQIINETYYWLPNDAALPFVNAEIRDNPAIFPPRAMLEGAEVLLPLSVEGEALYQAMWEQVLEAGK